MSRSVAEKRAAFRALHAEGCFVIPNPWDVGSARMLAQMGFLALASSSAGFAWTLGRPDTGVTREEVLAHLRELSSATDLPVNADFESGFSDMPRGVAESVTLAVETGVAGLSIEDRKSSGGLFELSQAVERMRAARGAIEATGHDVMLIGRTETLLIDPTAVTAAIETLVALADAGADCLFAPGVKAPKDIAAMVRAVAPKPVNVLVMTPETTVAELAALGVRRISIGGSLARVAWGAAQAAAERIKNGSFAGLVGMPSSDLNALFATRGRSCS